jgi:hypothetical protein
MRLFLLGAFVLACGGAFFLWQDSRTVSYEILLALPLLFTALVNRPAAPRGDRSRLILGVALAVIVVANIALVWLGTIPWYAGALALPVVVLGVREYRAKSTGVPSSRDTVNS